MTSQASAPSGKSQANVPVGSTVVHIHRRYLSPNDSWGPYCNTIAWMYSTVDPAKATCQDCIQEYQAQEVEGALLRDACGHCGGTGTGRVTYPNGSEQYDCPSCNDPTGACAVP